MINQLFLLFSLKNSPETADVVVSSIDFVLQVPLKIRSRYIASFCSFCLHRTPFVGRVRSLDYTALYLSTAAIKRVLFRNTENTNVLKPWSDKLILPDEVQLLRNRRIIAWFLPTKQEIQKLMTICKRKQEPSRRKFNALAGSKINITGTGQRFQ